MIKFKSVGVLDGTYDWMQVSNGDHDRNGNPVVDFLIANEADDEGYYAALNVEQITKLRDALSVWLKGRAIPKPAKLYTGTKI